MTAPMCTEDKVTIRRRIITVGTFIEVQKKGKGTAIETHRVDGWKLAEDGSVEYLTTYGGKPGFAKSSIVRPEQVRSIPMPRQQQALAELAKNRELPKPRNHRRGGR